MVTNGKGITEVTQTSVSELLLQLNALSLR